jgi:hypothetical protein
VTRDRTVAATTARVCVLIDYATGRTELRPASPKVAALAAVVVPLDEPTPLWGTVERCVVPGPVPAVPLRWRAGAVVAVGVTCAVRALGGRRRRFRRLVSLACAGRALPRAPAWQARYAVCAVRWAARPAPVRWACLEESVSASVLLALAGRRAEWRHGVALDPVRLHAWIAAPDGTPVEEPPDTDLCTATHTTDGPGGPAAGRGDAT